VHPLDGAPVLHWHSDTFELPAGAVRLAESALYAQQGFRVGERAWALQFHPECDLAMRTEWAERGKGELRACGVDPASLSAPGTLALDERGRAFATRLLALA
jgi:GMP synthase (glutamine-hydrolysing)